MRALRYLAITSATAALAVAAAHPAAAAGNVLTLGSTAGTAVAVGDVLKASLVAGTKATFNISADSTTGASCSVSTLTAKVKTNPLAPGTATETLTGQTFGTCTSNIPGVTSVNSVKVTNLPYNAKITSAKAFTLSAGAAGKIGATVSLQSVFGPVNCVYTSTAATLTGVSNNTGNTIKLTNQGFTKVSGDGLCPGTSFLTATYGPILDSTKTNQKVFVH